MQRRRFLQSAGLGLAASSPLAQAAFDCYVERAPGAQLFTLRNELAENPIEAIRDLANAGVRDVELFGLTGAPEIFGMSRLSFRRLLERNDITMTCSHVAADALDIPALAANAEILGLDTIILGAAPGFVQPGPNGLRIQGPQTKQEMDELAELLNRLGLMFRRRGLQFAYHNHHVEFFEVDGEIPYNYIMWNTDPQMVRCELDIGWLALAGVDYLNVLDNFGNRTISCHMKDFNGNRPTDMGDFLGAAASLVPPGSGLVDFTAVMERMDYYNIRHGFVEIDMPRNAITEIGAGVRHLQSLRRC